jgi:hypothetical protein
LQQLLLPMKQVKDQSKGTILPPTPHW